MFGFAAYFWAKGSVPIATKLVELFPKKSFL